MDWGTHVVLSAKLLESCGLDKGAAVYSIIPVIDKEPPHFHRVYAHILSNQPEFLDVALEMFDSDDVRSRDFPNLNKNVEEKIKGLTEELEKHINDGYEARHRIENKIYAYRRIAEEMPVFIKHVDAAGRIVGDSSVQTIARHKLSAALSLLSHIYFDLWNNPVQVFLPDCSYCSAQWEFWTDIDYMNFRSNFYKAKSIDTFRKEIAASPVWKKGLKPEALIKAIIIRLGELGRPTIPYEVVDMGIRDFMRYLGINEYQRSDRELEFCHELEATIRDNIYGKYKKPTSGSARQKGA